MQNLTFSQGDATDLQESGWFPEYKLLCKFQSDGDISRQNLNRITCDKSPCATLDLF